MNTFVPAAFSPSTCLPTEEDRLLFILSNEEMDEKFALDHQARRFRPFTTNIRVSLVEDHGCRSEWMHSDPTLTGLSVERGERSEPFSENMVECNHSLLFS